jgi:RNA polymerase sigma-70 factor (ECF subfamily)
VNLAERTHIFATTHWSLVLRAADDADSRAASALEQLCRTYWYPLYAYVRRQGRQPEVAQDLTQAFFAQLLARGSLAQVSRNKGRFRSFLLASMNHFLADQWDHAHRQKRGGGAAIIALDALEAEERYRLEPIQRLDAAQIFDRRWAMTILERALLRLETEFADRPAVFRTLQGFLMGENDQQTSRDAARELGMTDEAVRATTSRMRKRCRQLVREEIASTVASPSDVDEEYRTLLAALRC